MKARKWHPEKTSMTRQHVREFCTWKTCRRVEHDILESIPCDLPKPSYFSGHPYSYKMNSSSQFLIFSQVLKSDIAGAALRLFSLGVLGLLLSLVRRHNGDGGLLVYQIPLLHLHCLTFHFSSSFNIPSLVLEGPPRLHYDLFTPTFQHFHLIIYCHSLITKPHIILVVHSP